MAAKSKKLIYGVDMNEGFVFMPIEEAEKSVRYRQAAEKARTWAEARQILTDSDIKELVKVLKQEFADSDEGIPKGWKPEGDTPFAPPPAYHDLEWPTWPARAMFQWVPKKIQDQFGEEVDTTFSGSYLDLRGDENELVDAFRKQGYQVEKNQALLDAACGRGTDS